MIKDPVKAWGGYLFLIDIFDLIWCLEVEKWMSKRLQIDDYNISVWKVLYGRVMTEIVGRQLS
jgi:hypothetical protein